MGFFSDIFKKKEQLLPPIDLSVLGTDVHSHLIPGIDDGVQTIENSIELLRIFENWGYKKVITTPHIMSDYYKNTPEIINAGLAKVREAIKTNGLNIKIEAAAEYYLDDELAAKIESNNILTFTDKKYFLFELPFISEPRNLNEIIFQLILKGYQPVLAHPERYTFWYNNFDKFEDMIARGVLFQANINSFTGHYSPHTKKIVEQLVDKNIISFLGSDCHNFHHTEVMNNARQYPYLHKLVESGKLLNNTL